jgi:hypothetical protein
LIAWQHPPEAVWSYTPRQADAFAQLGYARHRAEMSERLMIAAMGAQWDGKAIEKQLRKWDEE